MGVKELWSILEPVRREVRVEDLAGRRVAVDLSIWIVEAQSLTQMKHIAKPHLRHLFFRVSNLLQLDILPIIVVEGEPPEIKKQTMADRQRGRGYGASSGCGQRMIGRSRFNAVHRECCEMLDCMGVPWVQAAGEAEAMCAYLNYQQLVDGCITNDGDVFLYGARTVYRNFSITAKVSHMDCYYMSDIEAELKMCRADLIGLAVLIGCDYLPGGVAGVGRETALKLVNQLDGQSNVLDRMKQWKSSTCYLSGIEKSVATKVIQSPLYPFNKIIDEFLNSRDKNPVKSFVWRRPSVESFMEYANKKMEWVEEYSFSKVLPLATLCDMRILSGGATQKQTLLQPETILKQRVRNGVPCFEILWCHSDTWPQSVTTNQRVTVEISTLVSSAFPQLVEDFEKSRASKNKNKKTKKKNQDCQVVVEKSIETSLPTLLENLSIEESVMQGNEIMLKNNCKENKPIKTRVDKSKKFGDQSEMSRQKCSIEERTPLESFNMKDHREDSSEDERDEKEEKTVSLSQRLLSNIRSNDDIGKIGSILKDLSLDKRLNCEVSNKQVKNQDLNKRMNCEKLDTHKRLIPEDLKLDKGLNHLNLSKQLNHEDINKGLMRDEIRQEKRLNHDLCVKDSCNQENVSIKHEAYSRCDKELGTSENLTKNKDVTKTDEKCATLDNKLAIGESLSESDTTQGKHLTHVKEMIAENETAVDEDIATATKYKNLCQKSSKSRQKLSEFLSSFGSEICDMIEMNTQRLECVINERVDESVTDLFDICDGDDDNDDDDDDVKVVSRCGDGNENWSNDNKNNENNDNEVDDVRSDTSNEINANEEDDYCNKWHDSNKNTNDIDIEKEISNDSQHDDNNFYRDDNHTTNADDCDDTFRNVCKSSFNHKPDDANSLTLSENSTTSLGRRTERIFSDSSNQETKISGMFAENISKEDSAYYSGDFVKDVHPESFTLAENPHACQLDNSMLEIGGNVYFETPRPLKKGEDLFSRVPPGLTPWSARHVGTFDLNVSLLDSPMLGYQIEDNCTLHSDRILNDMESSIRKVENRILNPERIISGVESSRIVEKQNNFLSDLRLSTQKCSTDNVERIISPLQYDDDDCRSSSSELDYILSSSLQNSRPVSAHQNNKKSSFRDNTKSLLAASNKVSSSQINKLSLKNDKRLLSLSQNDNKSVLSSSQYNNRQPQRDEFPLTKYDNPSCKINSSSLEYEQPSTNKSYEHSDKTTDKMTINDGSTITVVKQLNSSLAKHSLAAVETSEVKSPVLLSLAERLRARLTAREGSKPSNHSTSENTIKELSSLM